MDELVFSAEAVPGSYEAELLKRLWDYSGQELVFSAEAVPGSYEAELLKRLWDYSGQVAMRRSFSKDFGITPDSCLKLPREFGTGLESAFSRKFRRTTEFTNKLRYRPRQNVFKRREILKRLWDRSRQKPQLF
ncbi:hypothetical protein Tsubulata_015841 [Turnera subulata]|uniref:Uncharacterized protein n=1 Tax=Turnera subulata TaxID=218843 RepID=A0A9Q0JP73_9ROSI|nr:hypothetical protein Tsubulata_015841 [Turnera subulata]